MNPEPQTCTKSVVYWLRTGFWIMELMMVVLHGTELGQQAQQSARNQTCSSNLVQASNAACKLGSSQTQGYGATLRGSGRCGLSVLKRISLSFHAHFGSFALSSLSPNLELIFMALKTTLCTQVGSCKACTSWEMGCIFNAFLMHLIVFK